MLILGLNAYHGDSSACILRDGRIVAAVEEERFRRIKHWAGFPSESIRYCLAEAGAKLRDVQHLAVNSDPKASLLKKAGYAIRQRPDLSLLLDRVRNQRKRLSLEAELAQAFPSEKFAGSVHRVEHHVAHLASAFLVSPFRKSVVVSVDGFGDFSSAAWGLGQDRDIAVDGRVYFPHSLGIFYQAITQYLGFPHYGDEYKMMGLAPYGQPSFAPQLRKLVSLHEDGSFSLALDYFRHHKEKVPYEWAGGIPTVGTLFSSKLVELLGPARAADQKLEDQHRDIARSAQLVYEEAFFHLLHKLHDRYGASDLSLAGGCAMNSVANGKVVRMTPFKRVYIQSAAGDAGGAIGAAMHVWSKIGDSGDLAPAASALAGDPIVGRTVMDHAYYGPGCEDATIVKLLADKSVELKEAGCIVERATDEDSLCKRTAAAIARGEVIGWFQGRLEWGPRALGNRSIVCDPRRADMKDILNSKIKRRESFRPFAPSIIREAVADWFEEVADVPFMMQVFQIRAEKRATIPAVTHVDGSGRLQTVHKGTNPRYYKLIEEFRRDTGVPMVLNTSFNENEPVVCRPVEALDCFLRTKMDMLVLGDHIIARTAES